MRAATIELLRRRGGNFREDTPSAVERIYSGCPATLHYFARAAVSPATTTVPGWAAELVGTAAVDFFGDMVHESAFAALAEFALNVDGTGPAHVPSRVHPWAPIGGWIGESSPKPVGAIGLSATIVSPNKLAAISIFTSEMKQWSLPAIERVVEETLRHDLGALLDQALLDTNAASSVRPAGLFASVTPLTASTATPPSEAMISDLAALVGAISTGAPNARPVIVANAVQALRIGTLSTGPDVIVSSFMPPGDVGAVDAGALAMMANAPSFAVSESATIHMSDTPSAIGSTGTPTVVAAPSVSLFQADMIAMRSTLIASWAKRRAGAAAIVENVSW